METVKTFSITRLSNGAHIKFHTENYDSIVELTPEALHLTDLAGKYKTAIDTEESVLNRQFGSTLTDELDEADRTSDNALGTLFRVIDAYATSPDPELKKTAGDLLVIIKPYRGVGRHEMMKQSAEVSKLTAVLTTQPAAAMVEKLYLTPAVQKVSEANNLVIELNKQRDKEMESVKPATDRKTRELRAATDALYKEITDTVYAYALIGTADDKAAATGFISALNVRVDHYKNIIV